MRTGVHVPPNVAKLMCQRVMTSVAVDPGPLEPGWSGNGMACLLGERWEFPNLWCGRQVVAGLLLGCVGAMCCVGMSV